MISRFKTYLENFAKVSFFIAVCGVCPAGQPNLRRFYEKHAAMGTEFTIELYMKDESAAEQIMNLAFEEVDRIEALLSNYRPSSELSRISREAGSAAITTDPETFRFLQRSVYWSQQSDGAFDITVGPLLRSWGFFFNRGRIPSRAELESVHREIGWRNIALDAQTRTVAFKNHHSMDLDPGSIGKGFAVDSIVALLRREGVTSAFISAGRSTVYGIGTLRGAEGWPVDVPDPEQPRRTASTVFLRDSSLSTGACTEKFFIKDGHRYCHIFDPRTMRPVEGMLQTTVIDPSATDSDALSTVVFVLRADESRRLLSSVSGARALIFSHSSTGATCTAINWTGTPCIQSSAPAKGTRNHD